MLAELPAFKNQESSFGVSEYLFCRAHFAEVYQSAVLGLELFILGGFLLGLLPPWTVS
jgi:hypothetical protein